MIPAASGSSGEGADPPSRGVEPAGRPVAGHHVVERADALQLGHVQAPGIGLLEHLSRKWASVSGPNARQSNEAGPRSGRGRRQAHRPGGVAMHVGQGGDLGEPSPGQVDRRPTGGPRRRPAPARSGSLWSRKSSRAWRIRAGGQGRPAPRRLDLGRPDRRRPAGQGLRQQGPHDPTATAGHPEPRQLDPARTPPRPRRRRSA